MSGDGRSHLLGFCSRHRDDAADAFSDGLLRDDDKRSSVAGVLQMAEDNRKKNKPITNCGGRVE